MTVTVQSLRKTFPEFANDTTAYPDGNLQFWIAIGTIATTGSTTFGSRLWRSMADLGVMLYAAHHSVIERKGMLESNAGIVPGLSMNVISSKSVDKVSINYDTQIGMELDAGHWNLSVYGRRFIHIARMVGSAPLLVGVGGGCVSDPFPSSEAWPGPDTDPAPGGSSFS